LVQQTVIPKHARRFALGKASPEEDTRAAPDAVRWFTLRARLAAILMGSAAGVAGLGFLMFWTLIHHGPAQDVQRADAIVALTGGEARIPEAVRLLAQGKGRRLLISGVNPTTTRRELVSLAPNSQHLFRCCIDVGREARDTIGNADETSQWVKQRRFRSLIVVTADYHMPRSLAELRRTLPDVELIPYPVQQRNVHVNSWWAYPGTMQLMLSEYLKFMPSFARCYGVMFGQGQGLWGAGRQCLNRARTA
jgi:uncharacterized SAM-binding protein YcdF (DUF218 family)